ncbi:hypothetical protein ACFWIW_10770 [Amycolatopsis sp. NPDC058340]|uniref:hypothetical protein n=1 Tax=Amycolatopsis sp. NPDC058340 TaxID=3346453 RepID=UPI0036687E1C
MVNAIRRPGETNAQFAARVLGEISQLPSAWGADEDAKELRVLAGRIARGDYRGDFVADSPEVRLDLTELVDVDGWLVRLNGEPKGVIDNEDLDDECPMWKQRDTADPAALYAQIEPYLHEPRKPESQE